MRARTEALVGVVSLALLATVAAALGGRENRGEAADSRASSYVAGPYGTRGLADALTRWDVGGAAIALVGMAVIALQPPA